MAQDPLGGQAVTVGPGIGADCQELLELTGLAKSLRISNKSLVDLEPPSFHYHSRSRHCSLSTLSFH